MSSQNKSEDEQAVSARASAREIADEAAEWAIRIDNGSIAPDRHEQFLRWLEADPRSRGALLRAQAALSFLDRGRALAGAVAKPRPRPFWMRRKLITAGALLAASIAGVEILVPRSDYYRTGFGKIKQVSLGDGSVVDLNTQSSVEVVLEPRLREVTLIRGEAWFGVAHEAKRPFIVRAGPVRVLAVGTAFAVRRHTDATDVLVTQGVVETWSTCAGAQRILAPAGWKVCLTEREPPQKVHAAAGIERALAWRDGAIMLEGETLAHAVAEFNRYNSCKLVIADPGLADRKLVGNFRATDPLSFARAVTTTLGASIDVKGNSIVISRGSTP